MTATIAEIQLLADVTRTTYYVRKGQEKDEPSMQSKSWRHTPTQPVSATIAEIQLLVDVTRTTYYI